MKKAIWIGWCWLCGVVWGVHAKKNDGPEVVKKNPEMTKQPGDPPPAEPTDYD